MCTSKIIGHLYIIAFLKFLLINSFEVYFLNNFIYEHDTSISSVLIALQAVVLLVVKIHFKLTKNPICILAWYSHLIMFFILDHYDYELLIDIFDDS